MKNLILSLLAILISTNLYAQTSTTSTIKATNNSLQQTEALTGNDILDSYNAKRKEFLKKRERAKQIAIQMRMLELARLQEGLMFRAARDRYFQNKDLNDYNQHNFANNNDELQTFMNIYNRFSVKPQVIPGMSPDSSVKVF